MTAGMSHDCIAVRNPVTVRDESIPVDRIPLGVPGDYKPCIAQLPGGELILTAFHQVQLGDGKIREDIILYRSSDGGLTWSDREVSDLLGREPYFSVARDGTLFITVHLLPQDVRNERGSIHSYIHRSGDRGRTWETTPILSQDIAGAPDDAWALTSRNVLELDDGALLLGVSAPEGHDLLWRSTDGGMNWGSHPCAFEGVEKSSLWWPFWAETILWQASNGDVLGLFRVDHRVFPLASAEPPGAGDQYERMILFRSRDGGATWSREPDLKSVYGEMYPSVIRRSAAHDIHREGSEPAARGTCRVRRRAGRRLHVCIRHRPPRHRREDATRQRQRRRLRPDGPTGGGYPRYELLVPGGRPPASHGNRSLAVTDY